MSVEKVKRIISEFNQKNSFEQQMEYLKDNVDLIIQVDNDNEFVCFNDGVLHNMQREVGLKFNELKNSNYFCSTYGVCELLELLGIESEHC